MGVGYLYRRDVTILLLPTSLIVTSPIPSSVVDGK